MTLVATLLVDDRPVLLGDIMISSKSFVGDRRSALPTAERGLKYERVDGSPSGGNDQRQYLDMSPTSPSRLSRTCGPTNAGERIESECWMTGSARARAARSLTATQQARAIAPIIDRVDPDRTTSLLVSPVR